MLINVDQRQKLERQKRERQTQDDAEYEKYQWGSPQKKADFNRKMRKKLEEGIKDLSDLVLLLESLPPNVLENATLLEDLPNVIKFVEVFLEKADPIPVAEHESGELRAFRNYIICMDNSPFVDTWSPTHLKSIEGKQYLMQSINITASQAERRCCDILKKHIELLQRYVDPSIMVIDDDYPKKKRIAHNVYADMNNKINMIGQCHVSTEIIKGKIPTNPPCKPRALIDGKLYNIPITEEETSPPAL